MPTPIEIILDPISLGIFGIYLALMCWEALAPGRKLPKMRGWRTRALLAFATYFMLASYLPLLWDGWLAEYRLFDLTGLGVAGGAIVGLLIYELVAYAYHRTLHASDTLWRFVHQMHHSSERLDTYSAFWFSPADMVGWTAVSSFALVLVLGIQPAAATILIMLLMFMAIFQHSNVRTPRWVGYIIQRPESHTIHHGKGLHRYNYADLPLVDMLFGTFRNPPGFEMETGFFKGASTRVFDMILGRDQSRAEVAQNQPQAVRSLTAQAAVETKQAA